MRSVTAAVQIHLTPTNPLAEAEPIYRQLLHCASHRAGGEDPLHQLCRRRRDRDEAQPLSVAVQPAQLVRDRPVVAAPRGADVQRRDESASWRFCPSISKCRTSFSIDRYLGNAWHLIPEPGPDVEVLVRFEKLVARNVAEVHLAQDAARRILARRADGISRDRVGRGRDFLVAAGLRRPGRGARAARLRRLIADRVGRLAARYAE